MAERRNLAATLGSTARAPERHKSAHGARDVLAVTRSGEARGGDS